MTPEEETAIIFNKSQYDSSDSCGQLDLFSTIRQEPPPRLLGEPPRHMLFADTSSSSNSSGSHNRHLFGQKTGGTHKHQATPGTSPDLEEDVNLPEVIRSMFEAKEGVAAEHDGIPAISRQKLTRCYDKAKQQLSLAKTFLKAVVNADSQSADENSLPSIGSKLHGTGRCRPCLYVAPTGSGNCPHAEQCFFCHIPHSMASRGRPSKATRDSCKQILDLFEQHFPENDPNRATAARMLAEESPYLRGLFLRMNIILTPAPSGFGESNPTPDATDQGDRIPVELPLEIERLWRSVARTSKPGVSAKSASESSSRVSL